MYRLAALALLLGTTACAQQTDYRGLIVDVFENEGCSIDIPEHARGRGFEEWFSGKLVEVSDIPFDDWLDRDGPHFRGIDDAMEDMGDDGSVQVDHDNFTLTLSECG